MRQWFLTVISVALLCFIGQHVRGQQSRVAEREAEWQQYVLPQSSFVRQTDPTKVVLFKVPGEWKLQQQGETLSFSGPHDSTLTFHVGKISDGIPLRDYVSAIVQPLRNLPGGADSLLVRRTQMAGLEAREIMFESDAGTVEVTRRIIWSTVSGPNALSVVLMTPTSNSAEIEPYLKAVVQSVTFVQKYDYAGFDALRSVAIKDHDKPTRIDEVQSLVESLTALDGSTRQSTINRLATIFTSEPNKVIDLALDGRPMVRSAVFEAIVQSRNNSLVKFLLRALDDREPFVAEYAARGIAATPNVVELLRDHSLDWFMIEPLARVWPFLSRGNQTRILEEIFAQPLIPKPVIKSSDQTIPTKSSVTVRATVVSPGSPPPPAAFPIQQATSDPNRQLYALTLLKDLPVADFKLPLAKILAAKNDPLTVLALQVAWERNEVLPAAELLKLLPSDSAEVRRLAALHLGESATNADISSIESSAKTPANAESQNTDEVKKPAERSPSVNDYLPVTISKIRFREQLSAASGESRQELIKKGLADPKIAEWVWFRFVRQNQLLSQTKPETSRSLRVLPLGENMFPADVTYYAALPSPATSLDKLGAALNGLSLESARSQANLVLIMSVLREQLAQQLDSPPGSAPTSYSGINLQEPIVLARWSVAGAPAGVEAAERRAIIFRVKDRARFERSLTLYQRSIGNFKGLTDYFSGGVRLLTILPAFLPLTAKAILEASIKPTPESPLLRYSLVGGTEWNGYSVKVVEQRSIGANGKITRDSAYFTYLGDTAVLAPNLDSLADVLARASGEQPTLAANPNFKRVAENPGEAIYFSNVTQLFAESSAKDKSPSKDVVTESGALKISNSQWENAYQIHFPQGDWLKPFIFFQPEELTAPRELLPRTTVAYYFMNFDTVAAWRDWSTQVLDAEQRKDLTSIWAMDFEKEILPELGPECGVAAMGLPNLTGDNLNFPWAAFFKLKSNKLERAFATGKLFSSGSTDAGPAHIKVKSGDLFAIIKSGFLILSSNRSGIDALDHKERLIASRDFSRAAKQAPAGLVAFGGYNLEAATSSIGDSGADSVKTQLSSIISSVANAFHSPNFYATASSDAVQGRFSLSMDREGRFSVSELSSLSKEYQLTYAVVEAAGVPIQNQERLSNLNLRIRAKAAGEIDRIQEDVSSPYQLVKKISDKELELRVLPRHSEPKTVLSLPIKGAEFQSYLQPGDEIRSDDKSVIEKARSIAGDEHDAWKVARKLADWTFNNIKWKRVDYATAPQTLATQEADCLEFSQLYVAMARSLGLPARIVSGLAYSGAAFGGHAWVEVYVGDWLEVDPTWGTDFVDATHIRNSSSGALLTYASLNLVDLEVLAAPRGIAEFQKNPRTLAEKLSQELAAGRLAALTSALDLVVLTDERMESGAWDSLSEAERDLMSSAYRRVLLEISTAFPKESTGPRGLRLLNVRENGERAEAILIGPGFNHTLVKFELVQRNGAWFLTEILQADSDLHIISETVQPTVSAIRERRDKKSSRGQSATDFVRVLLLTQKDTTAAIAVADRALQNNPKNRGLRHLKALALIQTKREDEAIQIWKDLAAETEQFGPAVLNLAWQYDWEDDAAKKKLAIEFYNRYREIEPDDPRSHIALARLYDDLDDDLRAESEHRAALKSDPSNTGPYVDYAAFLALRKRFQEAASVLDEADKKAGADDDLFGDLMSQLYLEEDKTIPEELALRQPQRMNKSADANLYLGYMRLENGKSLQALPLLKKAASLEKDSAEPFAAMAQAYRKLRNWKAALSAADESIRIDPEGSDGYFQKSCVLARLGRIKEALQSLEKAVELDPDLAETLGEEKDLKMLASRPEFKKLLAGSEPEQ